ncbi:protein wntless [Biomphalaria pfeifferi]|uniref:Protein wntless n=1 Tax=Biomphalaria pfeifferi TaxID=112525 RepID=A0AAD8FBV8_BIOPF|nr:protein wntless [Biomphalaria pfeifferi]
MAGVVLETLSNKKLLILSFSLAIILTVFFLIGGIVAPSPNSVMDTLTIKCYDKDNGWHLNNMKPFTPRGKDSCKHIDSFKDEEIELKKIDANEIVFSQQLPLPKEGIDLDMSRWFQNLIAVMDVNVEYDEDNPYPENNKPEMLIEAKLFYRDKEDDESDWKLLTESSEQRKLDCTIEPERRRNGNLYNCELISLFELGSVHYDYYLINIRLPIDPRNTMNRIGKLADMHVIAIFQNGGFTKVWFSMKTVLTIFALGIILSIMNCPIEWLTLAVNMPFMMLLNDIRDGAFYAMLLSFWIIFVGEHMMDQVDRNRLMAYWKHLTVVILGCLALFIFEMCERGRQLVNPFFSIWSSEIGGAAAFGFIITAGIAACIYFLFLCYLVFRVFRNISLKRTSLLHMSTLRRKYYSGLIFRFKFLMIVTLLCAALTVIFFIIGQLSEGQWKWGDIDVSLEYTSAFLTGVYGMWNVYVIAILYDTDTNSREEEVQLTQLPSEASTLTSFITKQSAD